MKIIIEILKIENTRLLLRHIAGRNVLSRAAFLNACRSVHLSTSATSSKFTEAHVCTARNSTGKAIAASWCSSLGARRPNKRVFDRARSPSPVSGGVVIDLP